MNLIFRKRTVPFRMYFVRQYLFHLYCFILSVPFLVITIKNNEKKKEAVTGKKEDICQEKH